MGGIYGSSYVTFSLNTDEDLFETILNPRFNRPPLNCPHQSSRRTQEERYNRGLAIDQFVKEKLEGGQIGKRGWCLQERHLPPRLIHLIDGGCMLWECCTKATCVCSQMERKHAKYQRLVDILWSHTDMGTPAALSYWHSFLRQFTKRELTVPTDNLTAIEGFEKGIRRLIQGDYLHGLWERDLPRGLLWTRSADNDTLLENSGWRRFSEYQAPYWSWSSVIGPTEQIEYHSINDEATYVAPDKVYVSELEIDKESRLWSVQKVSSIAMTGRIGQFNTTERHDSPLERNLLPPLQGVGFKSTKSADIYGHVVFDIPLDSNSRKDIWCLLIAASTSDSLYFALALQKGLQPQIQKLDAEATQPSESCNVYHRVGIMYIRCASWRHLEETFGTQQSIRIF